MIINGDGGCSFLTAYRGGLMAQVGRLGPKVYSVIEIVM